MLVKFRIRRDTEEQWSTVNPILALGEPGVNTTNRKHKWGDGETPWNDLEYAAAFLPETLEFIAAYAVQPFGVSLLTLTDAENLRLAAELGDLAQENAPLSVEKGGTGATGASGARANLGLGSGVTGTFTAPFNSITVSNGIITAIS